MATAKKKGVKTCKKCGVEKSLDEFHKGARYKGGYNARCKVCRAQVYRDGKERYSKQKSAHYRENAERIRSSVSKYKGENKAKVNAGNTGRRATKLNQTPEMNRAELVEIESMYLYNQVMPGDWHVDHIQPIAEGGLHHPSNLQILSEHDNCSKGATWD